MGLMFSSRYGRASAAAHADLATTVVSAAQRIATLLEGTRLRGNGPHPLAEVLTRLGEQQIVLHAAIAAYPLAIAIDPDTGNPDPLAEPLADLMAALAHTLTLYRNLDGVPDRLLGPAHQGLEKLARDALTVVAAGSDGHGEPAATISE